jgi:hypothetical protein
VLEGRGHEAELDPLSAGFEGFKDTGVWHWCSSDADFWGMKKARLEAAPVGMSILLLYQFRGVNWDMGSGFIFPD